MDPRALGVQRRAHPPPWSALLRVANLDHGTWLPETLRVVARHSLLYFFKNNNSNVSLDLVVSNDKADQANRSGGGSEGREEGAPPDQALLRRGGATAWEAAGTEKIILYIS